MALVIMAKITWPALIFAASRNDSVIGRISDLITSTKDKNQDKARGLDSGTNDENSIL